MYRLKFEDRHLDATTSHERMFNQLKERFPGEEDGFGKFFAREKVRYEKLYPCLQKHYSAPWTVFRPGLLKALPSLSLNRSVFEVLGDYFKAEKTRICFTFQTKYLGMSPWDCPGAFGILPYTEYAFGIHHVIGGLSRISEVMDEVVRTDGGSVRLSSPVRRIIVEGGKAKGVEMEKGERVMADEVVINADFGHAATNLFEPGTLRKYTPARMDRMKLSCSTFMLYLGLDKVYDLPHHTIAFAKDYRRNLEDIFGRMEVPQDPSIYVRHAGFTDPSLAPEGKSALYILVPAPNTRAPVDWDKERNWFRDRVIETAMKRLGLKDIDRHIEVEHAITPPDWERTYSVYRGATFNLAHTLDQMLFRRPANRFPEVRNCWLVGGGTHPGSGLPTIYESARISYSMICEANGIKP
jgi:phytoene desaturase